MTTVHSPTDSQNLLDNSNKKVRLRRCSPLSIIPSTTGASKSLGLVLPQLAGKLSCQSLRVIPFSGSLIDLGVEVEKATSREEINQTFKKASRGELKGLLEVAADEIVGVDVQQSPYSATVDPYLTDVLDGTLVKVFAWYDNEWGYSRRLVDLAVYTQSQS
jgi:glyceraldehyde 3-phosphate dehydrogenase